MIDVQVNLHGGNFVPKLGVWMVWGFTLVFHDLEPTLRQASHLFQVARGFRTVVDS